MHSNEIHRRPFATNSEDSTIKAIHENCYDYPQYWDLAFRDETPFEADFIQAAATKYCPFKAGRLLEFGCGGGRLVIEMASRGFDVAGFDLSEPAIKYLKRRLRRSRLSAEVYVDDMTEFRRKKKADVGYCMINTFRHLANEAEAISHLKCVAAALRKGGIYILGLHLLPPDADEEDGERWTARHGQTKVTMTLRVLEFHRRQRYEIVRFSMRVSRAGRDLRFRTDYRLRIYTAAQMKALINSGPEFELLNVYDFCYEIEEPLKLNDDLGDTVLILQRR
ncbi:MAG: SAM-dependent methyltransferase [Planctomycetaceae bacterium]|nr:SAM-dependent methyltransferase [Planctomycetaceae bacterium]